MTGGSLNKYFTDEEGESKFSWYKIQFWIVIVSGIVLLMAGGQLSNLRVLNKFPDEEDIDDNDNTNTLKKQERFPAFLTL